LGKNILKLEYFSKMSGYLTFIIAGLELNSNENINELLNKNETLKNKYVCKTSLITGLQYLGFNVTPRSFIEFKFEELASLRDKYGQIIQEDRELNMFLNQDAKINNSKIKYDLFIFDKNQIH
jgi:hypothetical protein